MDRHRLHPKARGGTYTPGNVQQLEPRDHMTVHDNLRIREARFEELKAIIDDRNQVMKVALKVNNQLLAYKRRTDHLEDNTIAWLEAEAKRLDGETATRTQAAGRAVKKLAAVDAHVASALTVRGIGPITVAVCATYIDITKARHASSLWAYAGLHKPSHNRYTKNETSGGNKTLRTALYNMAMSQVRVHGAYESVYLNTKARLAKSQKVVKTRNTQGHLVETPWAETKPSHRHGAALRAVMKHFLADYWYVGRSLAGLPCGPCYAEAQLGDHRTVMPEERGWKWQHEI